MELEGMLENESPLQIELMHEELSDCEGFILVQSRKKEKMEGILKLNLSHRKKEKMQIQEDPGLQKTRGKWGNILPIPNQKIR